MFTNSTTGLIDLPRIFGEDPLSDGIRDKLGEMIRLLVDTELENTLEAARYARSEGRKGSRNGTKPRTVHTSLGSVQIAAPRARIKGGAAMKTQEWQSELLPRYQRRTKSLDAALVGIYFCGGNTRRIKRALYPLLQEAPLSKSVISRLVQRLQEHVEEWKSRSLEGQTYVYLYLDATNLKVRILKKVRKIPVLVALGVRQDGQKEVLSMVPMIKESEAAWKEVLDDLVHRKFSRPILVLIDGDKGLRNAVETTWPGVLVQRCTVHKLYNLQNHAPVEEYPEIKGDYDEIVYAESLEKAKAAYDHFLRRWKELPSVVKSLEEAGEELLTFYRFPKDQWKSLRTTNPIERLNGEFKRRVKTQCSLPSNESAIILLFGLILSGQIRFRKINGYDKIVEVIRKHEKELKKAS